MLTSKDLVLLRTSPAKEGPMIISEDLYRCLLMYDYSEFTSITKEISFLFKFYSPQDFAKNIQNYSFVCNEYMDIVWTYYDIESEWARQRYIYDKACYLKSLADILKSMGFYDYYRNLKPFKIVETACDVQATLKDVNDKTPVAWLNKEPVTSFHKRLKEDAIKTLDRLPDNFSCLGYNFTKKLNKPCMRDYCGLSIYKSAEFNFSEEGIMITPENFMLFDFHKIEEHLKKPLAVKGNKDKLESDVKAELPQMNLSNLDPLEFVLSLFNETQSKKLFPLIGDRKAREQLLKLFV